MNPERNTLPLAADSFPSHVNAIVNRVADDEAEEQRLQEIERSMWKTKVYYQDPVTAKYLDKQFAINENASLKEAVAEAHKYVIQVILAYGHSSRFAFLGISSTQAFLFCLNFKI